MRLGAVAVLGIAGTVLGVSQASSADPATLADFWAGNATFENHATLSLNAAGTLLGGPRIEPAAEGWYLLYTHYEPAPAGRCAVTGGMQGSLFSRLSTDKGLTWGTPVRLVNAGARCVITDGDVYWDAAIGKWRGLYQGISDNSWWDAYYFETPSLGTPFSEPAPNPVVVGIKNPLWKVLQPTPWTYDAGTWEIVSKSGSYFYVTFHGFQPSTGRGYRGLAKTTNFRTFTPVKTLLSPANAWLPNGVGFGHASTLLEDGQYYMVAEGMDTSLLCSPGQQWAVGMFRSGSIGGALTGLPAGNPFLDDGDSCSPAYATLFKDGGETYLSYYRINDSHDIAGLVIKKLTASAADVCELNTRRNGVESGWQTVPCEELP